MKAVQKVALSLLIAVVVFSLFSLLAFSGLFKLVESNFYDARVSALELARLGEARGSVDGYNAGNYRLFRGILEDDSVRSVFSPNQSEDDILARENLFSKLEAEFPELLSVRIVDERGNVNFSTLEADVQSSGAQEIVYKPLDKADASLLAKSEQAPGTPSDRVIVDPAGGRLLYRLPAEDELGVRRGTALFSVGLKGLVDYLVKRSVIEPGQEVFAPSDAGILVGLGVRPEAGLLAAVGKAWQGGAAKERPIVSSAHGERLILFTVPSRTDGYLGSLVAASQFLLSPGLQALLMSAIFVTTFLLAFLALNLRQDKMLVLSERVKRFQIGFLKGYLENKGELDWQRWYREIELRTGEVKQQIKRGVGRLTEEREQMIDKLIDKSWEEILSVIGKRVEAEESTRVEVKGLEETIRRVLGSVELRLPPQLAAPVRADERRGAAPAGPVEEAVEELEEVTEPPADRAEEGGQAAAEEPEEALEEIEEADEAPAAEDRAVEATQAGAPERAALFAPSPVPRAEELGEALDELPPVSREDAHPGVLEAKRAEAPGDSVGPALRPRGEAIEELEEAEDEEAPLSRPRALRTGDEAVTELEEHLEAEPEEARAEDPRSFNWDALDDVEALDLEALFHGEELLADIDIFEEQVEEAQPVAEDRSEESEWPELEAVREGAPPSETLGVEAIAELPVQIEALEEESVLQPVGRGFSLYTGIAGSQRVGGRSFPEQGFAALDDVDQEPAPPEELVALDEEPQAPARPLGGEEAEVIEEIPAAEEAEEAEELEAADDAPGAADDVPRAVRLPEEMGGTPVRAPEEGAPHRGFESGVRALIDRKRVEVYTLLEVKGMAPSKGGVVELGGGVLQVDEETVRSGGSGEDNAFRSLVDSVVSGDAAAGKGSEERGDGPAQARRRRAEPRAVRLTDEGFDYGAFRSGFKAGAIGVMKSLMRVSQNADAIYAAILLPSEGRLVTEYSLGLEQRTASTLTFDERDPVYVEFLAKRRCLYVRIPTTGLGEFDRKISPKDLRFMQGSIYLPILLDGASGYLFFGLKDTTPAFPDYVARVLTPAH